MGQGYGDQLLSASGGRGVTPSGSIATDIDEYHSVGPGFERVARLLQQAGTAICRLLVQMDSLARL